MTYSYKCNVCGARFDTPSRATKQCPQCLFDDVQRDYTTVQFGSSPFKPHFNHAVGAYVTSNREFNDLLSVRGDEAGTTYSRVDPGDIDRPNVDDHIFDTQARTIHDKRINPADLV